MPSRIIVIFHDVTKRFKAKCTLFQATSIGFHGNVVIVWEKLVEEFERTGEIIVELGSDQTSCHNPFNGGYYPIQLNFEEAQEVGLA